MEYRSSYLFIDDTHIDALDAVRAGVVPTAKVSAEPLIARDRPWESDWRIGSYINVLRDPNDGLFKMWYGVGRKLGDRRGEEADGLAYAFSRDGIHW